jgi:hypothetical protein
MTHKLWLTLKGMREEAGGHLAARYDALHNGASVWHRKKESVRDGVACQQAHMQQ